jgi:hypothetical protein
MASEHLDKLDALAASLVRTYRAHGEFAVIMRTNAQDVRNLRLIYPQTDVTLAAELLHQAADALFDGNVRDVKAKAN